MVFRAGKVASGETYLLDKPVDASISLPSDAGSTPAVSIGKSLKAELPLLAGVLLFRPYDMLFKYINILINIYLIRRIAGAIGGPMKSGSMVTQIIEVEAKALDDLATLSGCHESELATLERELAGRLERTAAEGKDKVRSDMESLTTKLEESFEQRCRELEAQRNRFVGECLPAADKVREFILRRVYSEDD